MGLSALQHLVVLMMENRSFDHMLGALNGVNAVNGLGGIDGLTGNETNPDINGNPVRVDSKAQYQGQLDPDPDHHFAAVDKQIFGVPNQPMNGFVQSYYDQQHNVNQSKKVMYYFSPDKLPVLTTLAKEFAVFNRWFASIPGPTLCNRAFAHYGTSFGHVSMDVFYAGSQYKSVYERLIAANISSRVYYFDVASSSLAVPNLLTNQPQLFGTFNDFVDDCSHDRLPSYPSSNRTTPITTTRAAPCGSRRTSIPIITSERVSALSQPCTTRSEKIQSSGPRAHCSLSTMNMAGPTTMSCPRAS